jgi:hypothetical protein
MGAGQLDFRENERHLEGLLDCLLRMKANGAVCQIVGVGEHLAGVEVGIRKAEQCLGVLDVQDSATTRPSRSARSTIVPRTLARR